MSAYSQDHTTDPSALQSPSHWEINGSDPLAPLDLVDPELARTFREALAAKPFAVPEATISTVVKEILNGISNEISFGYELAKGLMDLVGETPQELLDLYLFHIHRALEDGPTLGRLMAMHLAPVIKLGHGMVDRCIQAVAIMRQKGNYAVHKPMEGLSELIRSGDTDSVPGYLGLLCDTFCQHLTYNQCLQLTCRIPQAVMAFPVSRRSSRISRFRKVIRQDFRLVDPFLEGLEKGLHLLSDGQLDQFLHQALSIYQKHPDKGKAFISLESSAGQQAFEQLQVSVSLDQVKSGLARYLRARTGIAFVIRPISQLPDSRNTWMVSGSQQPMASQTVCSDGHSLYLPDEIGLLQSRAMNHDVYKCLVRLESAYYEWGTFEFDLEQFCDEYHISMELFQGDGTQSDLDRFLAGFSHPELAFFLFTLFEHGRLRLILSHHYPGLIRSTMPIVRRQFQVMTNHGSALSALSGLYARIALDMDGVWHQLTPETRNLLRPVVALFDQKMNGQCRVTDSAGLVWQTYPEMVRIWRQQDSASPLQIPFERFPRPDLVYLASQPLEQMVQNIKSVLQGHQIQVYKTQIRKLLVETKSTLSADHIRKLILKARRSPNPDPGSHRQLADACMSELQNPTDTAIPFLALDDDGDSVCWYPEWDREAQDYLIHHVRVVERELSSSGTGFYTETLIRHYGLVRRVRRAFELLRPEGITILRQWVEGDEFDYRALLDYAMDRRAGITPSDRLYIKRVKQQRDVAVLLLVDMSRSTANPVRGRDASVLDVEKEALVLFCEALQVVGDKFAIAGFSGTGRLGVDFFRIKDLDERLADEVRGRIGALTPQRNTRMGAAIRHGASLLRGADAKVRLMIVLGDGFPNDLDYKGDNAIEDTRRAVLEARAMDIHVKAITVNIAADPKLDDLYGSRNHNVISDVRELPDRLLGLYGEMTR